MRRLLRVAPSLCGGVTIAVGAIVLAGWELGLPRLTSVGTGLPPMIANTALLAVILGASLILSSKAASRLRVIAGKVCAGIAAVISAAILVEYISGVDLRIDDVLISTGRTVLGRRPDRPSPHTAAASLLAATALLILDPRRVRGRRIAEILALGSGLVPATALFGYLFGVAALNGIPSLLPHTGMGIPTIVALLALDAGILAAAFGDGVLSILVKDDSGGTAARHLAAWMLGFVPVVCAIALGARFGLYTAPVASALVVVSGSVAGSALVLRLSWRLSRLDAKRREIEEERAFLAELGASLVSTLDLEATLASIGRLVTRARADLCILYVMERGHQVRRVKAVTRDPAQEWIRDLVQHAMDRRKAPAIWAEMKAHRSMLVERVSPEWIDAYAQDEAQARALRAMNLRSAVMVPLVAHGKLVGAMCLLSLEPSRAYTSAEVRFAEQVAQRAALAVENARLYDEARRAIQSRDEVLGVVAHDLRNPLGTILLQAAHLRQPTADPEHRVRQAESIVRSANRMNRLIQDLLDVTRIEAGRLSIEQARVAAGELVEDVVKAQRPLAAAAALELRADAERDLPGLLADRDRLLQVFENLIGNAIKFTGAGGTIVVGAAPRAGEVLFRVADTGVGIIAEDLSRVFGRFWQARGTGRSGAGLGLPIVKGIVEAHGGRIWVESTPDRGSTFFFTIPAAPRVDEPPALPAP